MNVFLQEVKDGLAGVVPSVQALLTLAPVDHASHTIATAYAMSNCESRFRATVILT